MVASGRELALRGFGRAEAARAAITMGVLGATFAVWWFGLSWMQDVLVSTAPGGRAGPWVVRPIVAFHFGACAVMCAVTVPLVIRPLQRRWKAQDAAAGSEHDPFGGNAFDRAMFIAKGLMLLAVYAIGLVFYLSMWTAVGPMGIEEHLPWGRRAHRFDQVMSLETIPAEMRSEEMAQNGPWYRVGFAGGSSFTFSGDNEGCSQEESAAIAAFIAERTGADWHVRADAQPRRPETLR